MCLFCVPFLSLKCVHVQVWRRWSTSPELHLLALQAAASFSFSLHFLSLMAGASCVLDSHLVTLVMVVPSRVVSCGHALSLAQSKKYAGGETSTRHWLKCLNNSPITPLPLGCKFIPKDLQGWVQQGLHPKWCTRLVYTDEGSLNNSPITPLPLGYKFTPKGVIARITPKLVY